MRMETLYLETTIFSFYYDTRPEAEIVARRNWTKEFWEACRNSYEFVTSTAVLRELERGSKPHKVDALNLALTLPAVSPDDAVDEIVRVYQRHKLMPLDPSGDVLHLALACYHGHDFLVTWNCQHLANASKTDHIRRVNALLDLPTPKLVTPLELLGAGASD